VDIFDVKTKELLLPSDGSYSYPLFLRLIEANPLEKSWSFPIFQVKTDANQISSLVGLSGSF